MTSAPPREALVDVTARASDGISTYVLGRVVLEDLGPVLERISDRTGPRGPNGPMTQWILQQAVRHMREQLRGDGDQEQPLMRVLSTLIGHEPFVTMTLGMSVHQLTRRWPVAADWYADLVAYALRPSRVVRHVDALVDHVGDLVAEKTFGEAVRIMAGLALESARDPEVFQVGDTIEALWPEHPLVVKAQQRSDAVVQESWGAIYTRAFSMFGLQLHRGVKMSDVVWALQALFAWEIRERRLAPPQSQPRMELDAFPSGEAALTFLAGSLETVDGRCLERAELDRLQAPPST